MSRAAALVAVALVACGRPAATVQQRADLAGLEAALTGLVGELRARPDDAGRALAAWQVPAAAWPTLVTVPFRGHHPAYAAAFAVDAPALGRALRALATASPITVRWQYADDPALGPDQARLRVALPVGRPGAIATVAGVQLAPVFAHDGRRWRMLAGLDRVVVDAIAARAPACVAPYRAAAREPCLAMSAPVITAALADDGPGLDRACERLTRAGCGSVGDVTPQPPDHAGDGGSR